MDYAQGMQKYERLKSAHQQAEEDTRQAQKKTGRLSAKARAEALFDRRTFVEVDALSTQGNAVCGWGLVDLRPVYLLAQDAVQAGGAMSRAQAAKIVRTLALAKAAKAPVVIIPDSTGALVDEGAPLLAAWAHVYAALANLKGECPIIAFLAGNAVGFASHAAALCDVAIAVEGAAHVMPFPSSVQNAVNDTALSNDVLGGAQALLEKGVAAISAKDESEGFAVLRRLLGLLPQHNGCAMPLAGADDLNRLVEAPPQSMQALALDVLDRDSALPLYDGWRQNCHTWLGRIGGHSVGLVATNPLEDGGRLDGFACDKAAKLVNLCAAYGLPVVTLLDTQGLAVPGAQGQAWLMTASARMLSAYARCQTPKIALITGQAVGDSYISFAGQEMADMTMAWPGAYIAPLTLEAAVQAFDLERLKGEDRAALEEERAQQSDAFAAARLGLVDQVIDPQESRKHIIAALELLCAGRSDGARSRG